MKYTRKFFDKFEWFHKPISPIEESFMLPLQVGNSLKLITERTGLVFPEKTWTVLDGYLYFSGQYWRLFLQPGLVSFVRNYLKEIGLARDRWLNDITPSYLKEIDEITKINLSSLSFAEKLKLLERIAENEGELFAESIYVVIYCASTEIFLKLLYPIFVKNSKKEDYYELLIGYSDKGIEMDSKLWQISQIKEEIKRENEKKNWISKFGYRIQDKDLLFPTLGENVELINQYLKIYKDIPDPRIRQKAAEVKRQERERFVKENLRKIPFLSSLFLKIMAYAQEYSKIRNSRPFYYSGNRYMRRILLNIADQIGFLEDRNDIFFLHMDDLEKFSKNKIENNLILDLIKKRKVLYKRQLITEPEFEKEA